MKYKQAYLINSTAFENLDDDLDAEIPLHRKSSEDEEDLTVRMTESEVVSLPDLSS